MRPYKLDTPENTIHKARSILNEIKCLPYEVFWANPSKDIYSVRIETDIVEGKYGQNGKGKTKLYALASAYGEYLERMQNGYVVKTFFSRKFLNKLKTLNGFYFYPDEVVIDKNMFIGLPENIKKDITIDIDKDNASVDKYFDALKENGYSGCLSVPFYNVLTKEIVNIPYILLKMTTGSNGMAAGNTVSEAIYQGLCELLERYSASEVYFSEMTPPSIPHEFFKENSPAEYEMIQNIQNNSGFIVDVKNFSASKKMPCIGVILYNKEKTKYRLNVGCELNISIALSRALTEIYQGIQDNKSMIDDYMLDIPTHNPEYFLKSDYDSFSQKKKIFNKFCENGSGVYPVSLFKDEASYTNELDSFRESFTFEEDNTYLINLIHSFGENVYIRDVSFLGFPSVFVYIPQISRLGKKLKSEALSLELIDSWQIGDKVEDQIYNLRKNNYSNNDDLKSILDLLYEYDTNVIDTDHKPSDFFKIEVIDESHLSMHMYFFCFVGWLLLGDYSKAQFYLTNFLKKAESEDVAYYQVINDYFDAMIKNQNISIEEIKKNLSKKYDKQVIDEVFTDLSNRQALFSNVILPACPDCESCGLSYICTTKNQFELQSRIQSKMKSTLISQNVISKASLV